LVVLFDDGLQHDSLRGCNKAGACQNYNSRFCAKSGENH